MISIIVAVYNIADYLHYCVDSILNQTNPDWELILVNDGSTDDSLDICKSYSEHDGRIKVVSKKNGGLSSARNAGIDIATGDWVMFVDGDDYLLCDTIERLKNCLEQIGDDTDVIQYGFQEVDTYDVNAVMDEFLMDVEIVIERKVMFEKLLSIGGEAASMCTKLIRADLFNGLRFQEGIIHEDEQLTPRLLLKCHKIGYIPYKPYVYVKRRNSIITSRFNRKRLDIIAIMNERFDLIKENGLQNLIPSFRLKYIQSLITLFMAASTVKDTVAANILKKECRAHLEQMEISIADLPLRKKWKLLAIKFGIPVLEGELILRKFLHKEIRYE